MLWSVIKIVLFICLVLAASYGAIFLLELEGGIQIVLAGQEFNLTPIMSVITLIVLVILIWLLLKLASFFVAVLRFLNGDETSLSRYFDRNRQEKGYRALSEGMVALASGEGSVAMAKADKAERYLRKPALTNLITAQAAEMSGNRRKAEEVYKRLLTNDKTRFVGVRGILRQKIADGDTDTALELARKAFSIKPQNEEIQDTLLQLQAQKQDWSGARKTLSAKLRTGSLPRDVHRRREAVLALSEAKDILDDGKSIEARVASVEANRLSPDLVPAAVMTARDYLGQGSKRNATRVIRKAWDAQPHPDLAAVFAELEPNETPQARIKRFAKLLKNHSEHREAKLIKAELYLAAEDFPAARRALGDIVELDPDARSLTIMAAIERGEGSSDSVVKGWLARALTAPRGPQWVCDNCQHIHADWGPTCDNCQTFDSLAWKTPPSTELSSSTGLAMLPLIVGAVEDDRETKTDNADESIDTVIDTEVIENAEVEPERAK